jgi:hypothetical protein
VFEPLEEGQVLFSGDEFRVLLMAQEPVHAYVFHNGSGGEWICLFPNARFSLEAPAANPLEPGRQYWLPRFGRGFVLDDTPGREETVVYLSRQPHPRMEQWAGEGIPWQISPLDPGARGLGGTVQVETPLRFMNWYRRIAFEHRARPMEEP